MKSFASAKWTIVLALFGLVLGATACSKDKKPDEEPTADQTQQEDDQEDMKSVVIYGGNFNPNKLTIDEGTEVVFKNKDREKHNVKISALDIDQNIDANAEWSYTFETTGEFAVENRLATEPMKMTIVVK